MGIQYVARKPLKVNGRMVDPGEVVPEAATWRNVKAYVDGGSLAVALEVPDSEVGSAELKAQVSALAARVSVLESLITGDVFPGLRRYIEPVDDPEATGMVTGHLDAGELGKWSRDQLEAVAADLGIADAANKALYPNKDALIAAMVLIPVDVPARDDDADNAGA